MNIKDINCAFNIIYRLDNKTDLNEKIDVRTVRAELARNLALDIKLSGIEYDYISPIPKTGNFYTKEMSKNLGIPEVKIFCKNNIPKTFGMKELKRSQLYKDLQVSDNVVNIKNKKILFVDEALISGFTVQKIVQYLKTFNMSSFSFAFIAPPVQYFCPFGHMNSNSLLAYDDFKWEDIDLFFSNLGVINYHFGKKSFSETMAKNNACNLCFHESI